MTTEEKPPRKPRARKEPARKRLTEQQITTMGEIFPGFDTWYVANYDADGNLIKPMPGLTPPQEP